MLRVACRSSNLPITKFLRSSASYFSFSNRSFQLSHFQKNVLFICNNSIIINQSRLFKSNDDEFHDDNFNDEPIPNNATNSMVTASIPAEFPIVPLIASEDPILPKSFRLIKVKNKNLINLLLQKFKMGRPYAGVFKTKQDNVEFVQSIDDVHNTGTFIEMKFLHETPNETLEIVAIGHRRIEIVKPYVEEKTTRKIKKDSKLFTRKKKVDESINSAIQNEILMVDTVNRYDEDEEQDLEMKALHGGLIDTLREIMKINVFFSERIKYIENKSSLSDIGYLIDMSACACQSADSQELQMVLEEKSVKRRMRLVLDIVKKELEYSRMQGKIMKDAKENIDKEKRRAMLEQALKSIKRDLGMEKDDKEAITEKFKAKMASLTPPQHVKEAFEEELNKFTHLDSHSAEFNVSRNYLDWLTNLPWGMYSDENFDLDIASKILDEDHYGMEEVKKRILEFIAVSKLKGHTQGKILCFHGPPGVGKTSFAKSIARALHRKYYRFSIGGISEVSEIKGHRRTYVGAMPGKIIQGLKNVKTENPLILIDEVDKIGKGFQGDPASALLELLDPEQNSNFLDLYIDLTVDLSKVLFICTANTWTKIPEPLRDRMEMIEISGYINHEKIAIAKNYLIPKCEESCGFTSDVLSEENVEKKVVITDEALELLIRQYCRESGVRNLQKKIEQMLRKAAFKIVKGDCGLPITIDEKCLEEYVGNPMYTSDRLYVDHIPPGIAAGLAWTSMGGSLLYIESACKISRAELLKSISMNEEESEEIKSKLEVTGQLGDVMKESVTIAHTFAMNFASQLYAGTVQPYQTIDCDQGKLKNVFKESSLFLRNAPIHVHALEGAQPKDGPSAGVTLVTALMSLAMNVPVKNDVAMTGELSLTGKVLRIGGLKEKILAARRSGIRTVIIPFENKKDYKELSSELTDGLTVHFVSNYTELFAVAFPTQSIVTNSGATCS